MLALLTLSLEKIKSFIIIIIIIKGFFFSASGIPETSKSGSGEDDISAPKLIQTKTETSEVEDEAQRLRLSCLNNLAACHFQWGHHTSCIQLSSAVLDINSQMVKALYRSVIK